MDTNCRYKIGLGEKNGWESSLGSFMRLQKYDEIEKQLSY